MRGYWPVLLLCVICGDVPAAQLGAHGSSARLEKPIGPVTLRTSLRSTVSLTDRYIGRTLFAGEVVKFGRGGSVRLRLAGHEGVVTIRGSEHPDGYMIPRPPGGPPSLKTRRRGPTHPRVRRASPATPH